MSTAGKLTPYHFVVHNRNNSVAVVNLQGEVRGCCVRMAYIVQECSAGVWGVLCEVWMVCCRGGGVRKWSKYVKCLMLCLYNQMW